MFTQGILFLLPPVDAGMVAKFPRDMKKDACMHGGIFALKYQESFTKTPHLEIVSNILSLISLFFPNI